MVDLLTQPLGYPFMVRGLVAVVLVGGVSAVVGTFVVLRGMAFFGDALAHGILPGIAAGYIVGGGSAGPLFWWGLGTAVVTALGIGALSRRTRLKEDTAIGIAFAGMFALGIALISSQAGYAVDLSHFLFGNVLGVSTDDVVRMVVLGGLVLLVIGALFKELVLISFDPLLAGTLDVPDRAVYYTFLVLLAVTTIVALQAVGVALMVAMLVIPAATAYLVVKSLARMIGLAAVLGALAGVVGLYLSYYLAIASGAAIVLVATALFLVTAALRPSGADVSRF